MRKWWRELPSGLRVAVIGVVAFGFYMGGGLIFGEAFDSAFVSGLFYALIFAGGTYFTQKRFRKTAAQLEGHGQSLIFVRYPNALAGSLSGVWQMGIATPGPGRIDFQPAVYDELVPSGRSRALTGLRTTGVPPRITTHQDNKQAGPFSFQVITVESDGGVIEIAASPPHCRRFRTPSSRRPRRQRPQDLRKHLAGHAMSMIQFSHARSAHGTSGLVCLN